MPLNTFIKPLFFSGLELPDHKTLSNDTHSHTIPAPPKVVIPVYPNKPPNSFKPNIIRYLVQVGDTVTLNQPLTEMVDINATDCPPVHASIQGTIQEISTTHITVKSNTDTSILTPRAPSISYPHYTESPHHQDLNTWQQLCNLSSNTLHQQVKQAGIMGMGGAGFPSACKLNTTHTIHTLLINAMECEPYITTDDRLMREQATAIMLGIAALCRLQPSIKRVLIGIEDNKPDALHQLQQSLAHWPLSSVTCLIQVHPSRYPSGSEKQLIHLLTGLEVPHGQYPASLGVLCFNVATCFALYQALFHQGAVTHRLTTLTGRAIPAEKRGNYWLPIGITLSDFLATVDLPPPSRLFIGGSMMNSEIMDLNTPITKTTQCVWIPSPEELPKAKQEQACIRCGHCADVCPAKLQPQQLLRSLKAQDITAAEHYHLPDCIECGACNYVCPSHIPLVSYYQAGKTELLKQQQERAKSARAKQRHIAKQQRLEDKQNQLALQQQTAPPPHLITSSIPKADHQAAMVAAKNQLKKAQKKWQDAQKALEFARKQGKDVAPYETKVTQLKTKMDIAKHTYDDLTSEVDHAAVD